MSQIKINRAIKYAQNVLSECGMDHPLEIEIETVMLSRGISAVQPIPIQGAQGRIIIDGDAAIISYDNKINNEGKRRFVLAHELGHFELHRDILNSIHTDDEKSLSEWYAKGLHEQEANAFAAEFLMPTSIFVGLTKRKKFDFGLIRNISESFTVSQTAALLKYKEIGSYPIAIIYCDKGVVEWPSFSEDFPLKYIPKGSKVPLNSVANDFYSGNLLPTSPEVIGVFDWFSNDNNCERYQDVRFYEQCIRIGKSGVLSCIWND